MAAELKSTRDLAMEKARGMVGEGKVKLTDDQKRRIAEVRRECEAKIAEKKILLAGSDVLADELKKLNRAKDEKIDAIYKEAEEEK